jgi:DNA-binding transcriptional LysR family regulator
VLFRSTASSFDLDIEVLFKEPFVLACAADHPLAARASIGWSDLEPFPLIRVNQRTGNRMIVDDALGARRERPKWRYEVQHNATAVGLVAAGVGVAVLPRLAIDTDTTSGVVVRPLRNPQVTRTLGVITKRGVPLSPLAAALRSLIVRRLNQRRRSD